MIYLITGNMGTGKTSMVLSWVLDNKFGLFVDEEGNKRPMFSVNIPNINKKLSINDVSPEDFMSKPLHENFEVGSIIFVDEASEIYPNRSSASKLPLHLEGLNKLRHYGLTLIVITQGPLMIDPFLRSLVSKHIHVERKQLGSKLYEWNSCQTSFNRSSFSLAYTEMYKPDERTFDLYESSTKHIKFKKSVSWWFYLLLILPFVVGGLCWYVMNSIESLGGDKKEEQQEQTTQEHPTTAPIDEPSVLDKYLNKSTTLPQTEQRNMTAADWLPTVADRPESAPIYNDVRKVVDFPEVAVCVSSADSCNCYTHQGTLIEDITEKSCRKRSLNRDFNPYRERRASGQ